MKIKKIISIIKSAVCSHRYVHENSVKCDNGRTYYSKCVKCGHEIKSWHRADMREKE